jgi:hypothetical protein
VFGHLQRVLQDLEVNDVGDEWLPSQVLVDAGFQYRESIGSGVYPSGHPADVMDQVIGAIGDVLQDFGEDDLVGRIWRPGSWLGKIMMQLG